MQVITSGLGRRSELPRWLPLPIIDPPHWCLLLVFLPLSGRWPLFIPRPCAFEDWTIDSRPSVCLWPKQGEEGVLPGRKGTERYTETGRKSIWFYVYSLDHLWSAGTQTLYMRWNCGVKGIAWRWLNITYHVSNVNKPQYYREKTRQKNTYTPHILKKLEQRQHKGRIT